MGTYFSSMNCSYIPSYDLILYYVYLIQYKFVIELLENFTFYNSVLKHPVCECFEIGDDHMFRQLSNFIRNLPLKITDTWLQDHSRVNCGRKLASNVIDF